MSSVGKFLFGSDKTTTKSSSESKTTQTQTPFNDDMQGNYNEMLSASKQHYLNADNRYNDIYNNANNALGQLQNNYTNNLEKSAGDDTYFKQAWGLGQGINQNNINQMNSQELNAYNDPFTRNAIQASNEAARLAYGGAYDQSNQNMIRSGMPNGSDHQTAMARVGAQLAANINAQNQATYLQRQNALEQNALNANRQLWDTYQGLGNLGINYANIMGGLNQSRDSQYYNNLANMYGILAGIPTQQSDALKSWGYAVGLGSNPTVVSETESSGTNTQDGQRPGLVPMAMNAAATYYGMKG